LDLGSLEVRRNRRKTEPIGTELTTIAAVAGLAKDGAMVIDVDANASIRSDTRNTSHLIKIGFLTKGMAACCQGMGMGMREFGAVMSLGRLI
jgi:hypothetical protein